MKVKYNNIKFDSDLEVEYYKHLMELMQKGTVLKFKYHPCSLECGAWGKYTPDFLVEYADRIEIIETKGYNQFSFQRDGMIHRFMKTLPEEMLKNYINKNNDVGITFDTEKHCLYQKIKFSKKLNEFVDWEHKERRAIDNARDKIKEQEIEIKELKQFKKNCVAYFKYYQRKKLTEHQKKVIAEFLTEIHKEIDQK